MPYVNRATYTFFEYHLGDTNIASNLTQQSVNLQANYTLVKEFTLGNKIKPGSKIRVSLETYETVDGGWFQITVNGVQKHEQATTGSWFTYTKDLIDVAWNPGDKIGIWIKNPNGYLYIRNVYLRGLQSQWEVSL